MCTCGFVVTNPEASAPSYSSVARCASDNRRFCVAAACSSCTGQHILLCCIISCLKILLNIKEQCIESYHMPYPSTLHYMILFTLHIMLGWLMQYLMCLRLEVGVQAWGPLTLFAPGAAAIPWVDEGVERVDDYILLYTAVVYHTIVWHIIANHISSHNIIVSYPILCSIMLYYILAMQE